MRRGYRRRKNQIPSTLAVLAIFGSILFTAIERFPEHLGPLVALTSLKTITGPATHIRDGDTIVVAGTAIRLGALDCAELGTPQGQAATRRMVQLTKGQNLICHLNGRSSYDRQIGNCMLEDGRHLSALMIRENLCGRYW